MVVKNINELRDRIDASCATIGNFDGVHLGHQKLIARVRDRARILNIPSVVITFDPHPLRVLVDKKTPPFITLTEQKLELISKLGVDYVLCLKFTKELAALEPEDFVYKYLVQGLKVKELIIGYDYAFGKGRKGNYELLKKLGEKFGFIVEQLPPVMVDGAVVSSTRIRDLVQAGQVWEARKLLGRFYRVQGRVISGQKRGGPLLGFPTANICLKDELFPKTGVYAVWVEVLGQIKPGVANIGYNPTFGNDYLSVEAHILDFKQNIYNQDIKVHFVQRLRSEKKFSGLDALKKQIRADIELGRKILNTPEALLH
ncbi:bifunctional riboflavin kinase/FAD synthetase [Desulfohalobiaceae bacterium Ax17]|uniref:bifunctional riboflavin kinase/FAD synthetase n=1 Tax=Desulfovulcanus ferrireducens TaxID=2831190 RepID=UPI00207BB798|nr:bifunctional riboflavin kinase/FAD synthetase [Desulfovulcanus ferrireducens]MBT8763524.1 bifunctional riboflavin kinase/FAD synthetase [Desulfovulcanus ferrireducens]